MRFSTVITSWNIYAFGTGVFSLPCPWRDRETFIKLLYKWTRGIINGGFRRGTGPQISRGMSIVLGDFPIRRWSSPKRSFATRVGAFRERVRMFHIFQQGRGGPCSHLSEVSSWLPLTNVFYWIGTSRGNLFGSYPGKVHLRIPPSIFHRTVFEIERKMSKGQAISTRSKKSSTRTDERKHRTTCERDLENSMVRDVMIRFIWENRVF